MRISIALFALVLPFALLAGCRADAPPRMPESVAVPPGTTRYLIGGDSRNDSAHVLPWAFRVAKARGATAFLFLGDMELIPQQDGHFGDALPILDPIPFYPVVGNHEVKLFGFSSIGQKKAVHAFRMNFMGSPRTPVVSALDDRITYSVNLPGGLHFVALDNVSQSGFGSEQLAWLARDLAAARREPSVKHIVVGMHKPLAENGISKHGMDRDGEQALVESKAALALFVEAKVALVMASHVHQLARYMHGGIECWITGGLGAPLDPVGPEHAFHHVLALDVTDAGVAVEIVRFAGAQSQGTGNDDDDLAVGPGVAKPPVAARLTSARGRRRSRASARPRRTVSGGRCSEPTR